MTVEDSILSIEERRRFKKMVKYWAEIVKREDPSPLIYDLFETYQRLGVRVLFIIARYIELTEEPDE